MNRRVYDEKIRRRAESLRAQGKTYKEIRELVGAPKSTLSTWLGKKFPGIFDKKAQSAHLARIRPLAVAAKKKEKEKRQNILKEKICKEIRTYPLTHIGFLKSLLAVLYWAEGAKHKGVSGLRFVNTNPDLAKFYLTLLRKCYPLDERKFRIRLHLHYYHGINQAKKFWSNLLDISQSQFNGAYLKKRGRNKRFRRNFMGICFINYLDSNIRRELMELNSQLQSVLG